MNQDDLEHALSFARTFGKDYQEFKEELENMKDKIKKMKKTLDAVDRNLKGKIELK